MRSARFLIVLLAALALASESLAQYSTSRVVGPVLHPAPNALGFHGGGVFSTQDYDCYQLGGGYSYDFIVSAFASYFGDPNTNPPLPKAGDIYYTDIFITNPAACQSAGVQPWLILPANTSLAISGNAPVQCYRNGVQVTCSQNPQLGYSLSGAYGYDLGVWPDLHGGNLEIKVPVSSGTAGPVTLYFRVDTADGWSNPYITPSVTYTIGTSSTTQPTVSYPSMNPTPTSMITDTTARTTADVFNQFIAGTLYIDIGTTTNYESASTGGNAVMNNVNGWEVYADWINLAPGTLYHWRGRFVYGGGSTALGADQTFTTTGTAAVPGIPQGVTATPSSPTQVTVTWSTVVGATSYEVRRRGPSGTVLSYALVGTVTSGSSFIDTTVTANNAYLYKVRAVNGAGSSLDSPVDLATTVIYSDDRLIEFTSIIKLAHLTQLRTAVDAVRALANMNPGAYTDPTPIAGVTTVKAIHILELRTQYDQAIGSSLIYGRNSSWATTPVQGGPITFVDFQQLRDRLK